nr:Chain C, DQ2-glia-a2 peptide [Triticum aestivum]6XP6_F Chain F, DQ2-glia-a2 peptide [Triticum aestivum]
AAPQPELPYPQPGSGGSIEGRGGSGA